MQKKFLGFLFSMVLLIVLTGCSANLNGDSSDVKTITGETTYPLTIETDDGEITIESEPERVVSLSPGVTETIYAINAGLKLVGRTDYCNYPEQALSVPSIGSYASPNLELILSKNPDLIITGSYVSESILDQLKNAGVPLLTIVPTDLEGVEKSIITIGQALNCNDDTTALIEDMQEEYDSIQTSLEGITEEDQKKVFIDLGNFYSVGPGALLNSELVSIYADNIAEATDQAYPQLSAETIVSDNPDVFISLVSPPEILAETPGLNTTTAFQTGQVYYYANDSQEADMIQRPGPRIMQGLKLLAQDIYPDAFKENESE